MSHISFADLNAQHQEIRRELDGAIAEVLDGGQFVLGPQVSAFEREFADYCEVEYAVGTNSGTSALHLALLAAGIGPGDEVVTVAMTFWATIASVLYTGATPVLIDIDPATANMDPNAIESAITSRTKAILPVHLYGRCAEMESITTIARDHGLVVIEDAAQAAGSTYKGRPAGSLGDIACFSFYPAKNLGAIGEGGVVVTNNDLYADRIRLLRDHGSHHKYLHEALGYNYRLEAIQAAALRVKLKHLNSWNERRRAVADAYRAAIVGVALLGQETEGQQNFHIFPVLSADRDGLREHLSRHGVETGIHYPIPAHKQPALAGPAAQVSLPQTDMICRRELSLPMHPNLTNDDVRQIATAIEAYCDLTPRT